MLTMLIAPRRRPPINASRSAEVRIGGSIFIAGPMRSKSSAVRRRNCGQVSSVRVVPMRIASSAAWSPNALDRCAMCRWTPDSLATAAAAETATASASGGRDRSRSS